MPSAKDLIVSPSKGGLYTCNLIDDMWSRLVFHGHLAILAAAAGALSVKLRKKTGLKWTRSRFSRLCAQKWETSQCQVDPSEESE